MENLQLINDTMTEIEKQLDKKKLSDYNTQAEVIYLFSLSDKSKENEFVKNFVSCFKKNQSDEDLIKTINQKFKTEIKYDEFQKVQKSAPQDLPTQAQRIILILSSGVKTHTKTAGIMCTAVTVRSAPSNILMGRLVCSPATTSSGVKNVITDLMNKVAKWVFL